MKTNEPIWAKPPSSNISLEDCSFYTVQDIPGLSEPTKGEWDLRKSTDDYLGHVDLRNKTVLELGPASGYLTFYMEKMGGDVTSVELSIENDKWDIVPVCKRDWQAEEREHRKNDLQGVQNAYWYAHNAFNSRSRVVHSHIYDLSPDIGLYAVSLIGCVLLHLQNPLLAMQYLLSITKEKSIITDLLPVASRTRISFRTGGSRTRSPFRSIIQNLLWRNTLSNMPHVPFMEFLPSSDGRHNFAWWLISPEAIVNMASIFGFEKNSISYHVQYQDGNAVDLYTVVCERTIPIEDCYYSWNFTEPKLSP